MKFMDFQLMVRKAEVNFPAGNNNFQGNRENFLEDKKDSNSNFPENKKNFLREERKVPPQTLAVDSPARERWKISQGDQANSKDRASSRVVRRRFSRPVSGKNKFPHFHTRRIRPKTTK